MADPSMEIDVAAVVSLMRSVKCHACKTRTTRYIRGVGEHLLCCQCAADLVGELVKAVQWHGDDAAEAERQKGRSIDATA